jgi:Holliday junction resolvasome RuvABC endonuclease subunit
MEVSKSKTSLAQLTSVTINFVTPIQGVDTMLVGVDPGTTNLGIAVLDIPSRDGHVFQAVLHQVKFAQRALDVLGRIKAVYEVLDGLCLPKYQKTVIIEGASFGDKYRQVEMEDSRAGAATWFDKHNAVCQVIAPMTIRKNAFGNGTVKAQEYWKELVKYPDAAAALSCAICCLS